MNFNVYLDDHLAKDLASFCQHSHKKRNAVIRDALELYIHQAMPKSWPQSILKFKGIQDIEPFENYRDELSTDNRSSLFEDD